jgi:Flp pilus assembly pilin Flp
MTPPLRRPPNEDSGPDIIEYALLAAGIAIMLIPIVPQIGTALSTAYGSINTHVGALP